MQSSLASPVPSSSPSSMLHQRKQVKAKKMSGRSRPATHKCPLSNCNAVFHSSLEQQLHVKRCPMVALSDHNENTNLGTRCMWTDCVEILTTEHAFRAHLSEHTRRLREDAFSCGVAGCRAKAFKSRHGLYQHCLEHVKNTETRFASIESPCKWALCTLTFPSQSALIAHVYDHLLALTRLSCAWRDCKSTRRAFRNKDALKHHLRTTHCGFKPFVCNVEGCGKAFSQTRYLKEHEQTHAKSPHHAVSHSLSTHHHVILSIGHCEWRGCATVVDSDVLLHAHVMQCHGENGIGRRCRWGNCNRKKFPSKSYFVEHLGSHVGQKTFACNFPGCSKAFTRDRNRVQHIRQCHSKDD